MHSSRVKLFQSRPATGFALTRTTRRPCSSFCDDIAVVCSKLSQTRSKQNKGKSKRRERRAIRKRTQFAQAVTAKSPQQHPFKSALHAAIASPQHLLRLAPAKNAAALFYADLLLMSSRSHRSQGWRHKYLHQIKVCFYLVLA